MWINSHSTEKENINQEKKKKEKRNQNKYSIKRYFDVILNIFFISKNGLILNDPFKTNL